MKTFLLSKLRLSADEFAKTAALFFLFFLLVNGIFFGRNARDSIFLVKIGLAALPYAYMLNAVLAIACSFVYAMFVDKLDRVKLVRIILSLFIGALVLTFLGLQTEYRWFYWATYSIVQVIWLMSLMMFWTFAADFFDASQSKRIFPLIGMGGLIGMITSGLVAKPLVKAMGTEKLFLAWAALLCVALVVAGMLGRMRPKDDQGGRRGSAGARAKKAGQWEQILEGFQNVRRTPLLLNMVVLILALWIVFTVIDFQFNQVARANFTDESGITNKDALTSFLGIFRSWAGGLCLLFQLFLTPLAIRKMGVSGTMILHPGFLLLSITAMAGSFGFATTCVTKFGDHVLLYTATDVAYQLLFNPIPASRRGRARAFVEGYVKPFSMGLAGAVLLLLIALRLEPHQIAAVNLGLTMVWFASAWLLKKNYLRAVVTNLHSPQPGIVPSLEGLSAENNAAAVSEMEKRLASPHPDEVLFAVEYFIQIKHEPAARMCLPLLSHADATVRRMSCRAISELGGTGMLPHLERALRDSKPEVIREALAGIRKHGGEEQLPALNALHQHPDLTIVAEAVETAAEVGGFDGILGTADMLKRWSKSDDPRELELLASILGRLRIKSFLSILLDLAKHKNERVSRAAVLALTEFKDERVMPALVEALRDDILFPHVQNYFADCGHKFRETILSLYRRETTRQRVKRRFLEAIARISKWDPSEILVQELYSDDPVIRFLCIKYLSRRPNAQLTPAQVEGVLKRELEHWIRIEMIPGAILKKSTAAEAKSLLHFIFDEEIHRTRKTVFLALGFLRDRPTLQRIYQNAFHGSTNERALAMEALENMGLRPWVDILIPLLDGKGLDEARARFLKIHPEAVFDIERIFENLVTLSYDYLLSAILYVWKENRDASHLPMVTSLKTHTSGLVRENAVAAEAAILGG